MEEMECHFSSRRAGHQWLQRRARVEGCGTHTVRIFTETSTNFSRLPYIKQKSEEKILVNIWSAQVKNPPALPESGL